MLNSLYQKTLRLAEHRLAERWLAFISFIESSFFPIPPDVMLIPMALADRTKALRYAAICSIASVLGGFLGYAIGFYFWELIGEPLFAFYGYSDEFESFKQGFIAYGAWLVFIFGITFFPFKVITIASGVTGLDLVTFTIAMIFSRTPRFYIECLLIKRFGEPIREFIEKRLTLLTTLAVILGILGFVGLKYIGE